MALDNKEIERIITERFGEKVYDFVLLHDVLTFTVTHEELKNLIQFMKDDSLLRFNFLTDLCGVHIPQNEPDKQISVVYLLHNWFENIRVRVKTFLPGENPEVESVSSVFASANWMERETYDFYGVIFKGHPKLKRILNHDDMKVFPMRKEHPLEDQFRTDKDDRFFGREVNPNSIGRQE
ncbi:MAG: NADH-quinone oxidoreductase subunit C [Dysgonamonadaceae bacterium]